MTIRHAALLFCAAATAAQAVPAEILNPAVSPTLSVTAKPEKAEFVRGEKIAVVGTIRNDGDAAFVIDDYGDWLKNTVKVYVFDGEDGRMLMPRRDAPRSAVSELTVLPRSEKNFSVDLAESCALPPSGRFQAAVIVTRGASGDREEENAGTRRFSFSVVDGIELKSAVRARSANRNRPLRFSLVYWDQAARQNLFLRVSDPESGAIVAFYRLGAFIGVSMPSLSFPEDDTAVVVQQISRDRFARTVVSYAAGAERIVSRDDNLVSADAFSDTVSSRIVNERVERVAREREEEKQKGGFFRRRTTRTYHTAGSTGASAESDGK